MNRTHEGRAATSDDFSVAVSMRGSAAHLEIRGTMDGEATRTLEVLLGRLPAADIAEVVLDLTDATVESAQTGDLTDILTAVAPHALGLTFAGGRGCGPGHG